MGTIEGKTCHKEEKRRRECGAQGPGEKLMDGFAFEDTVLKFEVQEARWNGDESPIGKDKSMGVGRVFAKGGDGWKSAPDGRLQISREKGCLQARHGANGNQAVREGEGQRKQGGESCPEWRSAWPGWEGTRHSKDAPWLCFSQSRSG